MGMMKSDEDDDEDELSPEDKALFRESIQGTIPLGETRPISAPEKKNSEGESSSSQSTDKKPKSTKIEKLENFPLSDFSHEPVTGEMTIEYSAGGISHKDMRRLKSGEFRIEGAIDLHGATADEAREAFLSFLEKAQREGWRCVRIVHGKGKHRNETPVLKNLVNTWLRQLPFIVAFCSAMNRDGGTGAVYVLLSRGCHAPSSLPGRLKSSN